MANLTPEQQEKVLADLRWYGKTIAGGGPMIGYRVAAAQAETHWYDVTLPLLNELNALYVKEDSDGNNTTTSER